MKYLEIHYNTLGVCHQLSTGFDLKHGMLSGDEGVKIKSTRVSSNLNLLDDIKKETERLLEAKFIRSCQYAEWISQEFEGK